MKYLNRLKGMNKSAKLGLISTAVYAASTFAIPALAASREESKPITIEAINLEGVNTIESANLLFHQKIREYCFDKKLNYGEAKNLHSILIKEKELSVNNESVMGADYVRAEKELTEISKKKSKLEEALKNLKQPNDVFLSYLSGQREKLEVLLEEEYPGIINKDNMDLNVAYSSDTTLYDSINAQIKKIVEDVHSEISLEYNNNTLKDMLKEQYLELGDVVKLLKVMKSYESVLNNAKNYLVMKGKLEKEIQGLESQVGRILQKEGIDTTKRPGIYLRLTPENLTERLDRLRVFSDYVTFNKKAEMYISEFQSFNDYWSTSLLKFLILEDASGDRYDILEKKKQISIQLSLNDYLISQDLGAKATELKNPIDLKFPIWWWVSVNGFVLPMIRNLLVRKYIGDAEDIEDYFSSVFAGFGNGCLGLLVTDGLHPLAFPIRMLTPVAIQPIKKLINKLK